MSAFTFASRSQRLSYGGRTERRSLRLYASQEKATQKQNILQQRVDVGPASHMHDGLRVNDTLRENLKQIHYDILSVYILRVPSSEARHIRSVRCNATLLTSDELTIN